jgi:5-methylcytosine-specific restriction endonuclease McrA
MKNKKITKELDKLWADRIKSIGRCERCGKTINLQAHHIIPRNHHNTRWDLTNGVCLCLACHLFWAHKNAIEFAEWIKEKLGEKEYQALRLRGQTIAKNLDKEAIRIYLTQNLSSRK